LVGDGFAAGIPGHVFVAAAAHDGQEKLVRLLERFAIV